MNKGSKVAVTVLLVIGFFIFSALLTTAGISKTFVGMLALGLFLGIRTMWRKKSTDSKEDNYKIKLNKNKTENKNITHNR